jgi:hypothetical protein
MWATAGDTCGMGLGTGRTEHSGPRDMARKDGHWGFTEEAKEFATRARRRDENELLRRESDAAVAADDGAQPNGAADDG